MRRRIGLPRPLVSLPRYGVDMNREPRIGHWYVIGTRRHRMTEHGKFRCGIRWDRVENKAFSPAQDCKDTYKCKTCALK